MGQSYLRGSCYKNDTYYERGEYGAQSSHFQEESGHGEMRDDQEDPEARDTPYGNRRNKKKVKLQNVDRIHITVWRDKKPVEREMGKKRQDGTLGNWFKITIPNGIKYDKTSLMNSLQTHCSVPFTPVDVRWGGESRSSHSTLYLSLQATITKRYDDSQQALDLQRLRFDPDLLGREIEIILNRRSCMAATLKIIENNFPQLLFLNLSNNKLYQLDGLSDIVQMVPTVKCLKLSRNMLKSAWEVGKMKGLKLEELWLNGNPLCDTFPDKSSYVKSVGSPNHPSRECMPLGTSTPPDSASLQEAAVLDGKAVTPPVAVDSDVPSLTNLESYRRSEMLRNLVLEFLQQYFWIYDYGNRQGLLGAYHEQACFSLTMPFNPKDPAPSCMWQYFKDSRNIIRLRDPFLLYQLLRHTNLDIVNTLCMLPQTQHDLSSALVDTWFQTVRLPPHSGRPRKPQGVLLFIFLSFVVGGCFPGSVRAFTRTFIAVPGSNSSLCITNDELFVRDTVLNDTQNMFSTPVYTAAPGSVPITSQVQGEMTHTFSTPSGMNFYWSQK
ncbi:Nuclear RNA export factor 2 [Galemys pyrenaicus]|uniref:Nuclear RNA export factor 2 n=1 Tax=Galemys pyrenaicus TaxID=202257 RepID=A0A8J6AGX7_GALPY|nr:Nuclear RNA export factor 2 [Galemys pyrenaicus]